ncbi:MAG: hypothetical protein AB7V58_17150 [Solirubrobacterales bacterium]
MSAAGSERGAQIAALLERHYAALAGDVRKDRDCHWAISERFSYGRPAGWFVEHDGYCYDGLEDGEDGPYSTRAEAEAELLDHLLAAIAQVEGRAG